MLLLFAKSVLHTKHPIKVSLKISTYSFKVELLPSRKICIIWLIETPLKMIKNAFYLILKALSILKIFKFLSRHFGHV